jgi:hypothetical protein
MAGFKVWTTGDLVNASDFNSYLQEQVIMRFANSSARDSAVSSAEEGMFCFLQDTNTLQFYDGSSWTSFIGEGDITSIVTASTSGLSGGTTSGVATLTIAPSQATSGTVAGSDIILFGDADDSNNLKKTTVADINNLVSAGVSLGLVLALS